ncbi:DUF983 domain-containing protein [Pelagibacterium xiamenense]|uniref:DUF983 domain-containing protein n=1 Tax=Pelagibacterium xiamenense TaxID=2901140 RepID=UPI001E63A3E4|nr:DUF983 domain-containing protein [Pelagibacterium xiamenense]MCD7061167.1 DUF983 domain-containing protein [Pelagibacterium xiamenense]
MPVIDTTDSLPIEPAHRDIGRAMMRGLACKCPACGNGSMFRAYLKVADACPDCGEELFHQRADDAPPYLVIFIVGHIIVGLMLHIEMVHRVNPTFYLWTMLPLATLLCLWMLPRVKGAVVGLQWAKRMHGFDSHGTRDQLGEPR